MEPSRTLQILAALAPLVPIVAYAVFLDFFHRVHEIECECARHPYARVVQGFSVFAIAYLVALPFGVTAAPAVWTGIFNLLVAVAAVAVHVLAIRYVGILVRSACLCSEGRRREALEAWSVLFVASFAILASLPGVAVAASRMVGAPARP